MTPEVFAETALLEVERTVIVPGYAREELREKFSTLFRDCWERAVRENKVPAVTEGVWNAYRDAHIQVHGGVGPIGDASTRSILKTLVKKLGTTEAEAVAVFYCHHKDPFYVKAKHPPELLLRDVLRLRTEMATGKVTTTKQAKEAEQADGTKRAITGHLARKYGTQ